MSPASERMNHPEGPLFRRFFTRLLMEGTGSCWERDILRDNQDLLWEAWKKKAVEDEMKNSAFVEDFDVEGK